MEGGKELASSDLGVWALVDDKGMTYEALHSGAILNEKDKLVRMLESVADRSGGKLQVCERFYFAQRPPDLQMHFEIIENMDVS